MAKKSVDIKYIKMLEKHLAVVKEIAREAIGLAMREQCNHESRHRGGAIWEICDDCDMKWADDRGGFKPNKTIEVLDALNDKLDGY